MSSASARVQLEIEVGSEPISGWLVSQHGDRQPFSGWIEFAETVEDLRLRGSLRTWSMSWNTGADRRGREGEILGPQQGAARRGVS